MSGGNGQEALDIILFVSYPLSLTFGSVPVSLTLFSFCAEESRLQRLSAIRQLSFFPCSDTLSTGLIRWPHPSPFS